MDHSVLLHSTGDARCDAIVLDVLTAFDEHFPGRLLSCYLRGSRATGAAVEGSDLDLLIIFTDRFSGMEEFERARAVCESLARTSPILLEVMLIGENRLYDETALDAALDVKLNCLPLFGSDIRALLPEFDATTYVRNVIHTPYYSYSAPVQRSSRIEYPLDHIEPASEFFGFDQWLIPDPRLGDVPSTKLLVATVGWTATALVARHAGVYVPNKAASAAMYASLIGDSWTPLVVDVQEWCRNRWHYLIPDADADAERAILRQLCDDALDFQNHFLRVYRDDALGELASGDPGRRLLAAERLGQITYPPGPSGRARTRGRPQCHPGRMIAEPHMRRPRTTTKGFRVLRKPFVCTGRDDRI